MKNIPQTLLACGPSDHGAREAGNGGDGNREERERWGVDRLGDLSNTKMEICCILTNVNFEKYSH